MSVQHPLPPPDPHCLLLPMGAPETGTYKMEKLGKQEPMPTCTFRKMSQGIIYGLICKFWEIAAFVICWCVFGSPE